MTENDKLYPYLLQAAQDGFITYTKSTPEFEYQIIQRGIRLNFLQKTYQSGVAELTERGQLVVDANGDFSVLDESPVASINAPNSNIHIGNNSGNYAQNNDSDGHKDNKMVRNAIIAVITSTVAGIIVWFLTST